MEQSILTYQRLKKELLFTNENRGIGILNALVVKMKTVIKFNKKTISFLSFITKLSTRFIASLILLASNIKRMNLISTKPVRSFIDKKRGTNDSLVIADYYLKV